MNYDELHNNNSESTRMSYEENVRHHIFPIIGEKSIYELNVNDFDQIILHLKLYKIEKGKNKGKNLSSKFMNEIIHTVKSVIRYGIELYDMNEKFLKYLPDIKKDKDKVQQINPLELQNEQLTISPEDWDKVAKAMEEIINETPNEKKEFVSKMMLFLTTEYILLTRVGETQAMRYSNLLFDNGMYNLYEAYCKRVKKVTPTKNRKARILYLPPKLLNAFKKMYIKDSKETDFNENQFIFGKDKVFARTKIDRYRTKLLKRAGISYVTNHELRHAGISNALYNNADISALADMAGHDKEIMFKIYTQTLKEANRGLTNILGKLTVPVF